MEHVGRWFCGAAPFAARVALAASGVIGAIGCTEVVLTDVDGGDGGRDAATADAGLTFVERDVGIIARFSVAIASAGADLLVWPDGTLQVYGFQVDPNDGDVTETTAHRGSGASLWPAAPGPFLFSGTHGIHATRQDATEAWVTSQGCCRYAIQPIFAVSLDGVGYGSLGGGGMGSLQLATGTGGMGIAVDGFSDPAAVSGPHLYTLNNGNANIARTARLTRVVAWTRSLQPDAGPKSILPPAVDVDDSIVAGVQDFARFIRVRTDNTVAWDLAVQTTCSPVVTSDGRVIVSVTDGLTVRITAFHMDSGAEAWSTEVPSAVRELFLGDDGLVYATLENGQLLGHALADGLLLRRYLGLPGADEVLLRDGVAFVLGGGRLTAFPIDASGYQVGSPWPRRYHDNYHTMNRSAPFGD